MVIFCLENFNCLIIFFVNKELLSTKAMTRVVNAKQLQVTRIVL